MLSHSAKKKGRVRSETRTLALALAISAPVPWERHGIIRGVYVVLQGIIQGDQNGAQVLVFLRRDPA